MSKAQAPPEDLESLVLRQARAGLGPSRTQRQQTLARLASVLPLTAAPGATPDHLQPSDAAHGTDGPTLAPQGSEAVQHAVFSLPALVAGVVSGAVVGAVAGFALGTAVPRQAPNPPLGTPSGVPTISMTNSSEITDLVEAALSEQAASDDTPSLEMRRSSGRKKPIQRATHNGTAAPTATHPPKATLYDELSFVRRAQSALKRGQGALALGLMKELDQTHPHGPLLAERTVTKVLALCQLERPMEATATARRLLQKNADADVYRARLSASCAELDTSSPDE